MNYKSFEELPLNISVKVNLTKGMSLPLNVENKSRDLESIYGITIPVSNIGGAFISGIPKSLNP